MEFQKSGEDLRVESIYNNLQALLSDTQGLTDFAGDTYYKALVDDEVRIAQVIFDNPELPQGLREAKSISLFHQEDDTDEPAQTTSRAEAPTPRDGYIVAIDDGELTTFYGFYRTSQGFAYDKALQLTKERPAMRLGEQALAHALYEFGTIPTPEAWMATLINESREKGDFDNPNNWEGWAARDLAEVAARLKRETAASPETSDEELRALSELFATLRDTGL